MAGFLVLVLGCCEPFLQPTSLKISHASIKCLLKLLSVTSHTSPPDQALTIAVEEGDTVSQASTNGNLGIAYQGLGEDILALKHLDAHLTISRECQDTEGQLKALSNLGNFHANKSDFNTAQDLFQEQLEISQARGRLDFGRENHLQYIDHVFHRSVIEVRFS